MNLGPFRRGLMFLAGIFAFASILPVGAQERGMGGVGMTVFKDRDFRGTSSTFTRDMPSLSSVGFNRNISSFRVGSGERWEVCDQPNYRGNCVAVYGEESDLRRNNWNDKIASFRRIGETPPQPGPSNPYIVLYEQVNYRGNPSNYSGPVSNLNRRAQSVTIGRGVWQFCEGFNFTGRCVTLDQSVPNLSFYSLSRRISSARPVDFPQPEPPQENWYVVVFPSANYSGTPGNYSSDQANINRRIGSITIGRGVWEVCTGRNFSGNCQTLSQSVPNFSTLGIGTNIRSIRAVRPQPR